MTNVKWKMKNEKGMISMKSKVTLALCILSLINCRAAVRDAGQNGDGVAQPTEVTRPNNSATMNSNLAAASNAFGFDLFQQLRRQEANKNVFFSPLSVTVALAMTYNGAAGETKNAMARALKIEGMNHAELNRASGNSTAPKSPRSISTTRNLWRRSTAGSAPAPRAKSARS